MLIGVIGLLITLSSATPLVKADDNSILPPATPANLTAVANGANVQLNWSPSEAGSFPVAGYLIQRSQDGQNFVDLTKISADQTSYTDSDGQPDLSYRVTAIDDQNPPNTSLPSDAVTSSVPSSQPAADLPPAQPVETKPNDTSEPQVVPVTPGDQPLSVTPDTTLEKLGQQAAEDMAAVKAASQDSVTSVVETIADNKTVELGQAITSGNDSAIPAVITQYKQALTWVLDRYPTLSPNVRSLASDRCNNQTQTLETDLTTLPETMQISVYEALALCHNLQEQP